MVESPMFDVFLAHNSVDKPQVRAIAEELRKRGLKPWLDEEQIPPGRSFQEEIQQAIPLVKSAAIFIGSEGLGRWQVIELRSFISRCVRENISVIPVLLPNVSKVPDDLLFLQEFSWVSFASETDALESLDRLVWGITGRKPDTTNTTNKEAAIAQYRQRVEEFAADGEISVVEFFILQDLQEKLGLDPEEARVIRDQVLKPYGKYQEKLDQYRQIFTKLVAEQGYPLENKAKTDLRKLQDYLKLKDEDVISLEKEAESQKQLEIAPSVQPKPSEIELKSERGVDYTRKKDNKAPITPGFPSLQVFKFDVVTVDASGQIVKREKGQAQYSTEDLGNGVTLEMVAIPGGTFQMGSPEGEGYNYEKPQHQVKVQPFFIGKYPVTQAQWRAIASLPKVNRDLNPEPYHFKGDNRPVEQVSWYNAVEFCKRLSRETRREYRLPSEAEWEYACRAGTTTLFHFGATITTDLANYDGNFTYAGGPKGEYRGETTPVGSFSPNAFGLYDMHGNVWEWCVDTWHENYEGAPTDDSVWTHGSNDNYSPLRGGSWDVNPDNCRSAFRDKSFRVPGGFHGDIGFRVVGLFSFKV